MLKRKRKDKRYNDYFDNYSNRILDSMKGGFLFLIILLVIFGLYEAYKYFFGQ